VCSLSAGGFHSLALTERGALLAWGANEFGQLGDGSTYARLSPVTILPGEVQAMSAGWYHSLAATEQGAVLALTEKGEVLAWGSNSYGQLGDGSTEDRTAPVQVLEGMCAVSAGYGHSLALSKKGEVWAWGWNEVGQIGDGTQTNRPLPVNVLEGDISVLSAGWHHNLACESERGRSWSWGENRANQLGNGSEVERRLSPTPTLDGHALKVYPSYFAISLRQLNELDEKARAQLGGRYRGASMRTVVEEVISPATSQFVNRGYARLLNECQLLPLEVFVIHCWDGGFEDFIKTVNGVFSSYASPPNLWICATALWQGGDLRTARRPGLDPAKAPFAEAMRRAQTVLVVRNTQVDLYTRLWCIWEMYLAERLGFRARHGGFLVAGSNRVFASEDEVDIMRCDTSELEDQQWILAAVEAQDGGPAEVARVVTQIRRLYYR